MFVNNFSERKVVDSQQMHFIYIDINNYKEIVDDN